MPTISTNDFKNGITIVYEGGLWDIIEFQFVKPGKGTAFVRSKLKNLRTGQVLEPTFDSKEKVEHAMACVGPALSAPSAGHRKGGTQGPALRSGQSPGGSLSTAASNRAG